MADKKKKTKGSYTIHVTLEKYQEDKELYEKLVSRIVEEYNKDGCPKEVEVRFDCPYISLGATLCHPLFQLWKAVRTIHPEDGHVTVINFPKYDLSTLKAMELNTLEEFQLKRIRNDYVQKTWKNTTESGWGVDGTGCAWGCVVVFVLSVICILFVSCAGGINRFNGGYDQQPKHSYDPYYHYDYGTKPTNRYGR